MKSKLRSLIMILLAACMVFSGVQVARQVTAYHQAKASREAALAAAQLVTPPVEEIPEVEIPMGPAPETNADNGQRPRMEDIIVKQPLEDDFASTEDAQAEALLALNLEALRQTNSDVLGWITIPDTVISYPLMKAKDNQEYLYQTWDGKYSKFGSIFLECRNSHDLSDFNTLIYGHNMLTDDMFGTLLEYADQSHYESHPSVYVVTDSGVRRYDIFSAYEANVVSDTYRLVFEDDARRQSALELYTSSSVLDTGLTPGVTDSILTLSTCTGRGTANLRFVVQAVLAEEVRRGE